MSSAVIEKPKENRKLIRPSLEPENSMPATKGAFYNPLSIQTQAIRPGTGSLGNTDSFAPRYRLRQARVGKLGPISATTRNGEKLVSEQISHTLGVGKRTLHTF
jgi:hypothetical protein